jgi:type II secretory pathway component PulM
VIQGSLRERWQRLTRRERHLVFAAASVVALGLAYALLWLPLLQATARGESDLPQLRRQAERMRTHLDSKAASRTTSVSRPSVAELRAIAARSGIPAAAVQADVVDGANLRVRIDGVAGDPLMDLLDAAQRDKGWRTSEIQVVRLAEPGRVRAEFVLVGSGN